MLHVIQRRHAADPIIVHPDVRRMLLDMKAQIQVGRALCYGCAMAADAGDKAREDLLTPIARQIISMGAEGGGNVGEER